LRGAPGPSPTKPPRPERAIKRYQISVIPESAIKFPTNAIQGFTIQDFRFTMALMKATWNNIDLAESEQTVVVEGNHYFPPEAINKEYFQESSTHSTCPWKGEASYYNLVVNGQVNKDAAWYYPEPKPAAAEIKNHVAFWRGVKVTD